MSGLALVFLALLAVFVVAIALTATIAKLVVVLVVAGLVGWAADAVVPGDLPFGWLGAVAAGLVGSWLGGILIEPWVRHLPVLNVQIAGIHLVPAFVGAVILAGVASLVYHRTASSGSV